MWARHRPVRALLHACLLLGLALPVFAHASSGAATDERLNAVSFWRAHSFFGGLPLEAYDNLSDLTRSADVVVLGTIADVRGGREFEGSPGDFVAYAEVTVDVSEIVAGSRVDSQASDHLRLEVLLPDGFTAEDLAAFRPTHAHLLFLRSKAVGPDGVPLTGINRDVEAEFYLPMSPEAVFIDVDGRVATPYSEIEAMDTAEDHRHEGEPPSSSEAFLEDARHRSFEELVRNTRAAADEAGETTG
jgi:hypothetical protein